MRSEQGIGLRASACDRNAWDCCVFWFRCSLSTDLACLSVLPRRQEVRSICKTRNQFIYKPNRSRGKSVRLFDGGLRLFVLFLVVGGLGYLGYAVYDFFYGPVMNPTSCLRSTPLDDVKLERAICQGQVPSPPCPHSLLQYYCNGTRVEPGYWYDPKTRTQHEDWATAGYERCQWKESERVYDRECCMKLRAVDLRNHKSPRSCP
jgi:hypothetical protein